MYEVAVSGSLSLRLYLVEKTERDRDRQRHTERDRDRKKTGEEVIGQVRYFEINLHFHIVDIRLSENSLLKSHKLILFKGFCNLGLFCQIIPLKREFWIKIKT